MTFQVKYKNIAFHLTHSQVQFLISAREITVFYLFHVIACGLKVWGAGRFNLSPGLLLAGYFRLRLGVGLR